MARKPTCWLGKHTSRKGREYKGIGPTGCKIREMRVIRPADSQGSRARSSSSHSRGSGGGSGGNGGGGDSGGNGGGPAPSQSKSHSTSKRNSAARRSQSATSKRSDGGPQAEPAVSSHHNDGAAGTSSHHSSQGSRHVRRNQNVRLTVRDKRNREVAAAKAVATKAKQRTEHMREVAVHRAELLKEKKAREAIAIGLRKAERREKDAEIARDTATLEAYAKQVGGTVAHDYVRLPDKTIITLKDIRNQQGKGKVVKKRIETKAQREARLKK